MYVGFLQTLYTMEPYIGCIFYVSTSTCEQTVICIANYIYSRDAVMYSINYFLSQNTSFYVGLCVYNRHALKKDANFLLIAVILYHVKIKIILLATSSLSKRHSQISM